MNKKVFFIILCILILIVIISLILFFSNPKGNTENVKISLGNSEIYSKEDLEAAVNLVLEQFKSFPATLNDIWYDEEKSQLDSSNWAKEYNKDEAIILYSNFTTYSKTTVLNPNAEYKNYIWILVRNHNEMWELKTWGFC